MSFFEWDMEVVSFISYIVVLKVLEALKKREKNDPLKKSEKN